MKCTCNEYGSGYLLYMGFNQNEEHLGFSFKIMQMILKKVVICERETIHCVICPNATEKRLVEYYVTGWIVINNTYKIF